MGEPVKDHLPNYRPDQEERARVQQERALNIERSNGHKHGRSWVRRAIAGIVLGVLGYLVVSCVAEFRLHEPKIDRRTIKFDHR